MKTQIKRVLKAILLKLPGGKQFYHKIYLPRVLRSRSSSLIQNSSNLASANPNPSVPLAQSSNSLSLDASFYRGVLEQDLVLQEEWMLLLREAVSHIEFLDQYLPASASDQEAHRLLEEYRRHHKILIYAFKALTARQESQVTWLRTMLVGPQPVDADRIQRLEKVIEYLVEIIGEPHARRSHWEHQ